MSDPRTLGIEEMQLLTEYRFPIRGMLRTEDVHDVPFGEHQLKFHATPTGRITALSVIVKVNDPSNWPSVTPNTLPNAKWHMNVPSPSWEAIREKLRSLEGLLALHGVDQIDFSNLERKWLPENKEEQARLAIHELSIETQERPETDFPADSFDVIARCVLAAGEAVDLSVPLSFFRRGRLDMHEMRYIEAYYDYFFVLETLFGQGKHKQDALAAAFASEKILVSATRAVMTGERVAALVNDRSDLRQRINDKYVGATPEAVLASLVETRGFLHHHSSKRPGIWRPDNQEQFEIDAVILEELSFKVLWALTSPLIFSDEAVRRYLAARPSAT